MTYCARERYAVHVRQFLVGFYGTCRCTRSISPAGKKMYFLKQDPLRHCEWKLLDIMKNNSRVHTRNRKTASDTEFVTDAKSEKFFPTPFPDKCKRGQRALGANRKRERSLFATSKRGVALHWTVEEKCLTIILIFLRTAFPQLTTASSLSM